MLRSASRAIQLFTTSCACVLALIGSASAQTMRVHFIDVGQGASTLVEFPCAAILIDTGGEKNEEFDSDEELTSYLDSFFAKRPDLNKTLHLLLLTHAHVDHTQGVPSVLSRYKIRNAVTNGQEPPGPGLRGQRALHQKVADTEENGDAANAIGYVAANVKKIPRGRGLTNEIIDPVKCDNVDPRITLLWGGMDRNRDWTKTAFKNHNNHSVVTRIDFGKSSLLVTGDLQQEGIADLVEQYDGTRLLNTDVYQVGHHGSHNATTQELMEAVTPKIAVMAMGVPTRELRWTAWTYGHPRKDIVELLERHVSGTRDQIRVKVATGQFSFETKRVQRAIYGTGWDGHIVLEADTAGNWKNIKRPDEADEPAEPHLLGVATTESTLININTADAEKLAELPRVGFVRARAIVDHRTSRGLFKSIDELVEVKGIGPATVVTLQGRITVGRAQ